MSTALASIAIAGAFCCTPQAPFAHPPLEMLADNGQGFETVSYSDWATPRLIAYRPLFQQATQGEKKTETQGINQSPAKKTVRPALTIKVGGAQ